MFVCFTGRVVWEARDCRCLVWWFYVSQEELFEKPDVSQEELFEKPERLQVFDGCVFHRKSCLRSQRLQVFDLMVVCFTGRVVWEARDCRCLIWWLCVSQEELFEKPETAGVWFDGCVFHRKSCLRSQRLQVFDLMVVCFTGRVVWEGQRGNSGWDHQPEPGDTQAMVSTCTTHRLILLPFSLNLRPSEGTVNKGCNYLKLKFKTRKWNAFSMVHCRKSTHDKYTDSLLWCTVENKDKGCPTEWHLYKSLSWCT